ncbi:Mitochondrial transcription termination factor family protein [Thalictrum thalictroides]|uniref:Mitochondrial transcription termination factor family protein n=1 Tax=Thalictrum thalictroides TaxID=46969 RepID=A0A7J6VA76_THATH|nr:Mitochondrial transcription termination factor family protein [Thalictrum thalictroides]
MFRLFCKKLLHNSTKNEIFLQTQSFKFCSNSTNQHSPTVSYLVEKCGLSLDSAISTSKKIPKIEITEKQDSILQLFKTYGFTQTQIANSITKFPTLIVCNPVKTLKPKFEFFELSLGLSKPDVAKIVGPCVYILKRSLEKQIIPTFNVLKSFLHTNENVIAAFKRHSAVFNSQLYRILEPNIAVLRDHGVLEVYIPKLFMLQLRALTLKNDRFKEIVRAVAEMGFDPRKQSFIHAVSVMGVITKMNWENKLEVYKSFGLSEEDVISAFKLQPQYMLTSEKKIRKMMAFYMNELGLKASDISERPNLILLSLEERIIPRCSVLQVLLSNGLAKDLKLITALTVTKKEFEERYVKQYQKLAPQVLKACQSKLGYPRLDILRSSFRKKKKIDDKDVS